MDRKWSCPDDLFCGINTPKDSKELTDLEKKHTAVISVPGDIKKDAAFPVTIEVGKLLKHPNEAGHFIEWIELYSGDTFLARVSLSGGASHPQVTLSVNLTHACGPLKVWAKCNLHGLWETIQEIKVS